MKILCVCEQGMVRSASMAFALRKSGHETVQCGVVSPGALAVLSAWADRIVVMQQRYLQAIAATHHPKTVVVDIGPDEWGNPFNKELVLIVATRLLEVFAGLETQKTLHCPKCRASTPIETGKAAACSSCGYEAKNILDHVAYVRYELVAKPKLKTPSEQAREDIEQIEDEAFLKNAKRRLGPEEPR